MGVLSDKQHREIKMADQHIFSETYVGEVCRCGAPATHKVGEEIPYDYPEQLRVRHNLTAYVCCAHFSDVMGPLAKRWCFGAS